MSESASPTAASDRQAPVPPAAGAAETEGEYTFDDVSLVMGTYNEAASVGDVIDDIDRVTGGRAEIICVDGSTDETARIARDRGATVIDQEPQGYGVAVAEGIAAASRPIVVTTDCDGTYPMERLPAFVATINDGYDVVSGDRLSTGAATMPALNRLGNRLFALLASVLMARRVSDTTTGMRAYRQSVVDAIEWTENTGLSAELLIRPIMRGHAVVELPIEYHERVGESKLDPIRGGAAIVTSILKVCLQERWR